MELRKPYPPEVRTIDPHLLRVDAEGLQLLSKRVDAWRTAGPPKSKAGYRTIPLSEYVVNTLLAWRKVCPQMDTGLRDATGGRIKIEHYVFPNGAGFAENHANLFNRGFSPLQIAAGLSEPMLDEKGNPRLRQERQAAPARQVQLARLASLLLQLVDRAGKATQGGADPDGP